MSPATPVGPAHPVGTPTSIYSKPYKVIVIVQTQNEGSVVPDAPPTRVLPYFGHTYLSPTPLHAINDFVGGVNSTLTRGKGQERERRCKYSFVLALEHKTILRRWESYSYWSRAYWFDKSTFATVPILQLTRITLKTRDCLQRTRSAKRRNDEFQQQLSNRGTVWNSWDDWERWPRGCFDALDSRPHLCARDPGKPTHRVYAHSQETAQVSLKSVRQRL